MSLNSKKRLQKNLKDKAFRDAFVSSRIDQTVAFQLKALRQREELSQKALADHLGTSQNAVCRMESPNYGKHSVTTLKRIAAYFDVGLIVRFAPITEIADWSIAPSPFKVEVPRFRDEAAGEWFADSDDELANRSQASNHFDVNAVDWKWSQNPKQLEIIVNNSAARPPSSAIESLRVPTQQYSNRLKPVSSASALCNAGTPQLNYAGARK